MKCSDIQGIRPKEGLLPVKAHLLPKKVLALVSGDRRGFTEPGGAAVCFRKIAYAVNTPRYCASCTKILVPEQIHKSEPDGGA